MNIKHLLFLFNLFTTVFVFSQENELRGTIADQDKNPLVGATVLIPELELGTISDGEGYFYFDALSKGSYTLEVSYLGYEKVVQDVVISADEITEVTIICREKSAQLEGVTISSSVESQVGNRTYKPLVVNMQLLQATPQTTIQAINSLPGIRIRQQGGAGSEANIMLNGIGGKGIKVFYDGIPVDLLGAGFSLNNISSSMIKRIEVYKGTIPVEFGSDALGGIINIVSKNDFKRDLLEASYTYGSWNTNKATLGLKKKLGKSDRFSLSLDGYVNYSDNDYWMDDVSIVIDDNNNTALGRTRRFHDVFRAYFARANFEAKQILGGDQVKVMFNYSDVFKEWQHGITAEKPWGEAYSNENSSSSVISWKKYADNGKWIVDLIAGYRLNNSAFIDLADKTYFWGNTAGGDNFVTKPTAGESGIYSNGTTPELRTTSIYGRSNINYQLTDDHTFNFTSLVTNDEVQGRNNALTEENQNRFSEPQELFKSYAGLALDSKLGQDRIGNTLYLKHFYSNSLGNRIIGNGELGSQIRTESSIFGYGDVLEYKLRENISLNLGYEYTVRQPDKDEIFGDYITIQPNPELIPEKSHNVNVSLKAQINKVSAGGNFFYRNTKDQIFLNSLTFGQAQFINLLETKTTGVSANFSTLFFEKLTWSGNATYQNILLNDVIQGSDIPSDLVGERIPNIPYLFGNTQLLYKTNSPFINGSQISMSYELNYINSFLRSWDVASNQSGTPTQLVHSANVSWMSPRDSWSVSLECYNFTNARAYDNFFVQKPGRSFYLKTRYTLNN